MASYLIQKERNNEMLSIRHIHHVDQLNIEETILNLADEMAACTASLNAHTYKQFIDSRDELKKIVHELLDHIEDC